MKSIRDMLHDWSARAADARFFSEGDGLRENDILVSQEQGLRLLSGRTDTRARMESMAARFGLSAQDIDRNRGTALDVALACGECGSERQCRRYLSGEAAGDPEHFCPNASTYLDLGGKPPV